MKRARICPHKPASMLKRAFIFALILFGTGTLLHAEEGVPKEVVDGYLKAFQYIHAVHATGMEMGKAVNSNDYPILISKGLPRNIMLYPFRFHVAGDASPVDSFFYQDSFGKWMNTYPNPG
jgi:hypothetical protein